MKISKSGDRFILNVTEYEVGLLKDAVWDFYDDRKDSGSYGGGSQWDASTDGLVVANMLRLLEHRNA